MAPSPLNRLWRLPQSSPACGSPMLLVLQAWASGPAPIPFFSECCPLPHTPFHEQKGPN